MGLDKDLFTSPPDDNFLCSICYGVFQDPSSLTCGHVFCEDCIRQALDIDYRCPSCRAEQASTGTDCYFAVVALRGLVDNLQVQCLHNNNNNNNNSSSNNEQQALQEPPRQRRRTETGESVVAEEPVLGCSWVGKVYEWPGHISKDWPLETILCDVQGCDFQCHRNSIMSHMVSKIVEHTNLLVDVRTKELEKAFDEKLAKVTEVVKDQQEKLDNQQKKLVDQQEQIIHLYLSNFCRQWLAHEKPDALFDFVVYRPHRHHLSSDRPITELLFGIPGPKRTPWEGGIFPVTMNWTRIDEPPRCRLPKGFHHPNVYPSGRICKSSLIKDRGWDAENSNPEILFDIQQFFAHPNPSSPAQAEAYNCFMNNRQNYDQKARTQAQEYKHDHSEFSSNKWKLVSTCAPGSGTPLDWQSQTSSCRPPQPLPSPGVDVYATHSSDVNGKCSCSCCSWGASFWDAKHQMRFLFGSAG